MQIDLSLNLEVQEEEEAGQSGGEEKVLAIAQEREPRENENDPVKATRKEEREDASQDKSLQETLNPEEV